MDRQSLVPVTATMAPYAAQFGQFDFALSASEESRAARLHREAIIIDLMFQGPCGALSLSGDLLAAQRARWLETGSGDVFRESLLTISELAGQGRLPDYEAVWRGSGLTATNIQAIGDICAGDHRSRLAEFDAYPWYGQAFKARDLVDAKREGRCVSFLNLQYAPPTAVAMSWFDAAYEAGLRMLGLTYNDPNQLGAGCTSEDTGLTPLGRAAVTRMNDLGMIVDVAHAGKQTTLDACRQSKVPVIASHAGAEHVFMHARNKSDDELRALADTGGVIGVVAVPMFLTATLPGRVDLMFDHIDYIANLVGIKAVAIGTDWPMQLPKWVSEPGGPFEQWTRDMGFKANDLERLDVTLVGFEDYRDYPNITRGLVKRGYTDDEILQVLGQNALRVIADVWK